ncbi:hypothetical protein AYL99_01991 [Fonsecaea erecta]|uniref:Uncharacterized protein n=1 Tax=Fonsecaea erecta TaxID=1367422 RepID=A0A178ZSG8_9EURO|nr:hypothetical protein AYL99_01991 [Fonsecaea erecta]OAP62764.1 hypothetical protein AYL99_01991 [Fonsecaea erecta]
MGESQYLPGPPGSEFFSPLLTKIDRRTKDEITKGRSPGFQALEQLNDFIQELRYTAHRSEETWRESYVNRDSPTHEAEDYLEPQMFPEDACSELADVNNQVSLATSQDLSFEGENSLNLCSPSHGECNSDNFLTLTSIDPQVISEASAYQPTPPPRPSKKRICLPESLGGHVLRGEITKTKSKVKSTRSSQRQTNQPERGRTKTIAVCAELDSVVNSLILSVAGIPSIIQLKQALQVLRERQVASNMGPALSPIKAIWKQLDILESSTHANNVTHRLCLVRLNSRRNELKIQFGSEVKRKRPETSVIDKIAEEVEEEDRDKVKNRLHAGVIWDVICEHFSIGILALIPTGKADCPSNAT